jgi:TPR repeat protein
MKVFFILLLSTLGLFANNFDEAVEAYNTKSYSQALEQFIVLAHDENSQAQYNAGLIYANGLGVTADSEEASKWYEQSARQGYGLAQFNLAVLYDSKEDPKGEYATKAKYWYEQAVHSAVNEAYNNLGVLYLKGKGVEKSEEKALLLFEKGVALADSASLVNIALLYTWGTSTTHDKLKAKALFEKAIIKGQTKAKEYLEQLCTESQWVCEK